MKEVVSYFKGSFTEFKNNVEWPKWADLQSSMTAVAICAVVMAILCFGVDWSFGKFLQGLFNFLIGLKS